MKKRISIIALCIIFIFSLTSCKLMVQNEDNADEVVATVNGVNIMKSEVLAAYNSYRYYYNLTDTNQDTELYADVKKLLMDSAFDTLIEYQLVMQYGGKLVDVELTDEMLESIQKDIDFVKTSIETGANDWADDVCEANPQMDRDTVIKKRIEERLLYRGITTGEYELTRKFEAIVANARDTIKGEYEPSDKAIQGYYDTYLSIQKGYIEDNIANYDNYTVDSVNLYVPAGFHYVKNLLIAIPEEIRKEINSLRLEGKNEEADKLRDEELKKLSQKATDIYERIQNGESYEELLKLYGEDNGMKEGAANAEKGYRIYEGIKSYDENFVNGSLSLKNIGDVTAPIASDFGYFIIKLVDISEAHDVPIEEVRDRIREILIADRAGEYYDEYYETWKRQAEIIEYRDRLY